MLNQSQLELIEPIVIIGTVLLIVWTGLVMAAMAKE